MGVEVAKKLREAATRALAEAALRKAAHQACVLAPEISGRKGPEPTRFGDWENKGIASDF